MARNLEDYITVADRVAAFYNKYPEGSLRAEILVDDGERLLIRARALRTPDDAAPGIGHAEEIRGDSPVNRTSAVENCETSAWGRAIAALGFEVRKGIASREEIEQAKRNEAALTGRDTAAARGDAATDGQPSRPVSADPVAAVLANVSDAKRAGAGAMLRGFNVSRHEDLDDDQREQFVAWLQK